MRYLYLSASAPFLDYGKGCNVLGFYWCQALALYLARIETTRPYPVEQRDRLGKAWGLYWSLAGYGRHFLHPVSACRLESLLLQAYLWFFRHKIKASGVTRIFAFSGADWRFLRTAQLYAARLALPLDIYLVDDYEASLLLRPTDPQELAVAQKLEAEMLASADRVFCISPGFADHIYRKHGLPAKWLPMPVGKTSVEYRPWHRKAGDPEPMHRIFYIGSVNELYSDALRGFIEVLESSPSLAERYRLTIVSAVSEHNLDVFLGTLWRKHADVIRADTREELDRACQPAYAFLLPYSADTKVELMVKTSFPSKLTDYLVSGRPVLIHGPAYASAVDYAQRNQFPLVSSDERGLIRSLETIAAYDSEATIDLYARAIALHHSPEAIASILRQA